VTPASPAGTSLADPERTIERFLLERAGSTLSGEEAAIVEDALRSPSSVAGSLSPQPS
jgi:hypothetical protein